MTNITLKSSDGKIFETDIKVAKISNTLETVFEIFGVDGKNEVTVPLPNVSSVTLCHILEWALKYQKDDNIKNDTKYLSFNQDSLFDIVLAADYLEIKDLMTLSCYKVAMKLMDHTAEDIRSLYNIVDDFTEEEKAKLIKRTELDKIGTE